MMQNSEGAFFLNRLPPKTRTALAACARMSFFDRAPWYLAGGTALTLQVGHRQSVDLDFFTPRGTFQEVAVERALLATGAWETSLREEGTIYGILHGAKMSLIAYPFFVPATPYVKYGKVRMLAPRDIAAMKVIAVSQRGRKRDFVDLYWYCQNKEPLADVVARAISQYPNQKHNIPHFLKSLMYFADAEHDPMPRIFFDVTWSGVKKFFIREVRDMAHRIFAEE